MKKMERNRERFPCYTLDTLGFGEWVGGSYFLFHNAGLEGWHSIQVLAENMC